MSPLAASKWVQEPFVHTRLRDRELLHQGKHAFCNSPVGVLMFLGFATRVINVLAWWAQAATREIACCVKAKVSSCEQTTRCLASRRVWCKRTFMLLTTSTGIDADAFKGETSMGYFDSKLVWCCKCGILIAARTTQFLHHRTVREGTLTLAPTIALVLVISVHGIVLSALSPSLAILRCYTGTIRSPWRTNRRKYGSFVSNNNIFTILFFNTYYHNWINKIWLQLLMRHSDSF